MQHRHLNTHHLTTAAIDDIIRRGGWRDWVMLRRAAHRNPAVVRRIQRVCGAVESDAHAEGEQRVFFWDMYVKRLIASLG
jgi:hypothetical protein